jgi:hypothetical protein
MKTSLKIVSGANDRYIITLLDFINSLSNIKFIMNNVVIYNYGLNENNINKLINLQNKFGFNIENFNFSKYPDYVNFNNYEYINCSYAFKPITIYLESLKDESNYIIWSDCANRLTDNNILQIMNTLNEENFYSPITAYPNTIESLELHHPKCLQYFKLEKEVINIPQRNGAIIGLKNNSNGKDILNYWYNCCLNKDVICPNGSSRNNHRQDQSVLSMIMYIYEKNNNKKFNSSNFGIKQWVKLDDTDKLLNNLTPFKLIDNKTRRQLAVIYCKDINEAMETYFERKKYYMNRADFLNNFHVS